MHLYSNMFIYDGSANSNRYNNNSSDKVTMNIDSRIQIVIASPNLLYLCKSDVVPVDNAKNDIYRLCVFISRIVLTD